MGSPDNKPKKKDAFEEAYKKALSKENKVDTSNPYIRDQLLNENAQRYKEEHGKLPQEFNIDPDKFTDYIDINEIDPYNMRKTNLLRAQNQPISEKLWRTTSNLIGNTAIGLVHDAGALGILALQWGDTNDYSDALTEWANRNRDPFGKTYVQSDYGGSTTATGTLNATANLVQPLIQFGIEAAAGEAVFGALGAAASKGITGLARAGELSSYITEDLSLGQKILTGAARAAETTVPKFITSAGIGYVASVDAGAQMYKKAYTHYMQMNPDATEKQGREYAHGLAQTTVGLNTLIMTPLNFSVMKGRMFTKAVDKEAINLLDNEAAQMLEKQTVKEGESGLSSNISARKGALESIDSENKGVQQYLKDKETYQDYIKQSLKGGAQFAGMHLVGSSTTADNAIKQKDKGSSNRGSLLGGVVNTLNDITNGNDPDGGKELLMSFLSGMLISPGHRLVSSRIAKSEAYKYNSNGELIPIKDKEGNFTGEYESKKVSNYKANKRNREAIFNKYRNSNIKNLGILEESSRKLKLIADKGEKEAGFTRDDVYQDLFDMQSYEYVLNDASKFLINSLEDLKKVDNTIDLGKKALQDKTVIDEQLATVKEQVDKGNTELIPKLKELTDKSQELDKTAQQTMGKTEAMVSGFTNEAETKDNAGEASEYKQKAQQMIDDINHLDKIHKKALRLYGGGKEGAMGMPDYILSLEQDRLSSFRKKESLSKELDNFKEKYKDQDGLFDNFDDITKLSYLHKLKEHNLSKRDKINIDAQIKETEDKIENNTYTNNLLEIKGNVDNAMNKVEELMGSLNDLDISNEENNSAVKTKTSERDRLQSELREQNKRVGAIKRKIISHRKAMEKIGDGRLKTYKERLQKMNNLTNELTTETKKSVSLINKLEKNKVEIQSKIKTRSTFDAREKKMLEELNKTTGELDNNKTEYENKNKKIDEIVDDIKNNDILPRKHGAEYIEKASKIDLDYYRTNAGVKDYIKDREEAMKLLTKAKEKENDKNKKENKLSNNSIKDKLKKAKEVVKNRFTKNNKEEDKTEKKTDGSKIKTKEADTSKTIEEASTKNINNEDSSKEVPTKNGRNAFTELNENDTSYEQKKDIAVISKEASDTFRKLASKFNSNDLNKFATYVDDLAFLINSQKLTSDNDTQQLKVLSKLSELLSGANEVNDETLSSINNSLKEYLKEIYPDKAELIDSLSEIDKATNLSDALNEFSKSSDIPRLITNGSGISPPLFKSYRELPDTKEIINKLATKIGDSSISFRDIESGRLKVNKDKYGEVIDLINNIIFKERLSNGNDLFDEYANVANFIVENYKRSIDFKDKVDKVDYDKELDNINKIVDALNGYYNNKARFLKNNGEKVNMENFDSFYVNEHFEVENKTNKEIAEKVASNVVEPDIERGNSYNPDYDQTYKRSNGVVIANDSTGYDREKGESATDTRVGNKTESRVAIKIGDDIQFKAVADYDGNVNYFDGESYVRKSWKELRDEHQTESNWFSKHIPIQILHDGEVIGYVPMVSSVNKYTIHDTKKNKDRWIKEREEVSKVRKEILNGKTEGVVNSRSAGFINRSKNYGKTSLMVEHLLDRPESIGILKRDGVYAGGKLIRGLTKSEMVLAKNYENAPVLIVPLTSGTGISLMGRYKLNGENSYGVVGRKNSINDILDGMGKVLLNNKESNNYYTALDNTTYIEKAPKDSNYLNELASEIPSSNVGIFVHRNEKGNIFKFSLRNDSMEPIEIKSTNDIEVNRDLLKNVLDNSYFHIKERRIGTETKLFDRDEKGNLITKDANYNKHLGEVTITNVLEKEIDLSNSKVKVDNINVFSDSRGKVEYGYSNNAVNEFNLIDSNKSTKIKEKEVDANKKRVEDEIADSNNTVDLNDDTDIIEADFFDVSSELSNKTRC